MANLKTSWMTNAINRAGWMGAAAGTAALRSPHMAGAALGGAYGALSDDTSIGSGAVVGSAAGFLGGKGLKALAVGDKNIMRGINRNISATAAKYNKNVYDPMMHEALSKMR